MGQLIKFPVQATKFGYKRVKQRAKASEHPGQLFLFSQPTAQILNFAAGLSCFEQALMLDERGDSKAADLYRNAIEEQDCVADSYCNLGIIESKQGNTVKAFDSFTTSLKYNPRHSEAHFNLGNLYFDLNDLRLAQIHYEMAVTFEPSFPNFHFNLALVQAINNDFAAAINSLTRYQALAPQDDARNAEELLQNLKISLAASKKTCSVVNRP